MEDFCRLQVSKKDKLKSGSEDLTTTWQTGHICHWNDHCGYCQGDASEGVSHGPHGTAWWARRRRGGQGGVKWAVSTALKSSKTETADSGLDMIRSRPEEPEVSQKVFLLWPQGAGAKGPGRARACIAEWPAVCGHPYGGLRTVSGGPWNPESWMGNIWKDPSDSEYKH